MAEARCAEALGRCRGKEFAPAVPAGLSSLVDAENALELVVFDRLAHKEYITTSHWIKGKILINLAVYSTPDISRTTKCIGHGIRVSLL